MYQFVDDTNMTDTDFPQKVDCLVYRMQFDVNNVVLWLKSNKLELNESKTQLMFISHKKHCNLSHSISLKVEEETILCVNEMKCLGLIKWLRRKRGLIISPRNQREFFGHQTNHHDESTRVLSSFIINSFELFSF